MGTKGSNTTTSTSAPNPFATNAYLQLLNRAQNVGDTPYQPYTGQLTADVNSQQQAGVANINQSAGFASPYIQEAAGLARGASQPLTPEDIARYQSPYTQNVVDSTTNWFNNQNKQQQQNVLGNAAAQGALGGDRVGVAQANLAAQQTASQAPIIAGLYDKSYQSGLGVAQQQQANQGNAAYSLGNLGVAGQNAALSGANAQVGAGNLLQGNEQQRLNALYQQYQIQQAFPYQQTQWLAGLQSGVGSQLGGTSSTTAPAPNPLAQYAGVGLTAASMFLKRGGRIPGFAPGGAATDGPFSGVGWIPARSIVMGPGAPKAPGVAPQQQAAQTKPMDFGGRFGGSDSAGTPMDISSGVGSFSPSSYGDILPMGMSPAVGGLGPLYANGGTVPGFAYGGAPDDLDMMPPLARASFPQEPISFADRWAPVPEAITAGVGNGGWDPQGANASLNYGTTPTVSDSGVVPLPRERPAEAPHVVAGFGPAEDAPSPQARPTDAPVDGPDGGQTLSFAPADGVAPAAPEQRRGFNLGLLPDSLRAPLMTAGLAMLASRSPNLGNAIGDAGLAGVGAYTQQEEKKLTHAEKREALQIQTKRLDQAAEQARKALAETTRHHGATEGLTESAQGLQRERLGLQPGYRWNADRTAQEPIPGGAADPTTIKAAADAKRGSAGLLDEETIGTMAGQYLSGDKSVMQNLGRGAQGAENIVKLRAEITRQAKADGLTPNQIATKMADFAGRTAAMRALGTRGVNVEYAANTANKAIDIARETYSKLPRGQFVPFNQLRQLVDNKTSSAEQAAAYAAVNTLVNEYARVASGGSNQATEGMRHHAREMLNTAMGPPAFNAVLDTMRREIVTAKAAYNETRQEFLQDSHARDAKAGPDMPGAGANTVPANPKKGDRFTFKQGPGEWDGTKWVPVKP